MCFISFLVSISKPSALTIDSTHKVHLLFVTMLELSIVSHEQRQRKELVQDWPHDNKWLFVFKDGL